ncbi:MAG: TonB-dependent receptor [Campylobacterota bacterium]|nr:TonB-dependent receptor [Campylobacterota bacterium]
MKKIIPLSLIAVASLYAAEVQLDTIGVESTVITEVAQKAQTSVDLAQTLSAEVPSIDMSRRSGIANDIYIRGQKRDNISVAVDGTKVCGACVNRMDPPTSHILASQIAEIEVIEGPYDVENFGTLSGGIKVTTKQPTQAFQGELNLGIGAWGYQKIGASASGGNDVVRVLISATGESSGQYKDGDGNTIAEQVAIAADASGAAATKFQPKYEDMDAYKKQSVMAKAFVTTLEDQELRLSYTMNKSDDVLYGNSKMDAAYDDSHIYSVEYNIDNISDIYSNANLQYYRSTVDHPMDTKYRNAGATAYSTNHLNTTMEGVKFKNDLDLAGHKLLLGLDGSKRTWEGKKYMTNTASGAIMGTPGVSLTHTETTNAAVFAKLQKSFGDLNIDLGARYDSTEIKPDDVTKQENDYTAFSANILTSYNLDKANRIFLGFGQASRVPDARELYLNAPQAGNENLDQTTNQEIDLGYELNSDTFEFKIKAFYSMLQDYIYYNKTDNQFQNVDATIYGAELSASVYATDDITIDMGASYKVGEKDEALDNQTDTDLADIAPLRGNIALNYEYMNNSIATLEVQASDDWTDIDSDNGEQELDAWTVVNLKAKHAFNKNINLTVGLNNILDETYALSNTSADLILLSAGTDTMLMNEPGRYFYTNLDFKF